MKKRVLGTLAASMLSSTILAVPPAPTNLRIDCGNGLQTNPTNCNDFQPNAFTWSIPSGTYNAYQIRVDKASDFSACWLWDPPTISVASTTSTTVPYPTARSGDSCGTSTATSSRQAPWHGARRFYWRVRVSDDGGTSFSPWSTGTFSYETFPSAPTGLAVTSGNGTGPIENYGNTSPGVSRYVDANPGANCTGNYSIASRACNGADGNSYTTISACAAAAGSGDTCFVRAGVYSGATISNSAATKARPITIRGYSSETASVSGTIGLNAQYLVIDRLTFTSDSTCSVDYNSSRLIVKNSTFTGSGLCATGQYPGSMVRIGGTGSTSNHFLNNTVTAGTASRYSVIDIEGGTDLVIRGNDISSNGPRAINPNASQNAVGNLVIAENHIHDVNGADGHCVALYYGVGEFLIARNRIYNCNGGIAVRWLRGDWGTFRNNTIGRDNGGGGNQVFCYSDDDSDGQPVIENDSCVSTSIVFDFAPSQWRQTHKIQWRNSNYYRNGGGSVEVTNAGGCTAAGTNCIDRNSVSNSNPNVDANGRPQATSSALINQGGISSPVPVDGLGDTGTRVDIGRFEYQAAATAQNGTYSYNPVFSGINATPRISWTFTDPDNTYHNAGQSQSAYEVQIDTVNTFDSIGPWKPKCSSGVVSSSAGFWDVPAACGLATGTTYYFRVRTWDSIVTGPAGAGLWSDYANAFTVGTAQTNLPPGNVTNARRTDVH